MIRTGMVFFISAIVAATTGLRAQPSPNVDYFYVATNGNDENAGTESRPFASLAGARDAVRTHKKKVPDRDISVVICDGLYRLKETVVFGLEDSAAPGRTIAYTAYLGHKPVFSSDVEIEGWRKFDEAESALSARARGKVWVAGLPEGLERFNTLYDESGMLPRAKSEGVEPARRYKRGERVDPFLLHYPKGLIRNWPNLRDIEVRIVPNYPWVMNLLPLDSVDEAAGVARTAVPATYPQGRPSFGNFPNGSLWVENALEFLDEPGEWVLNTEERKIYLWPRGERPANIVAPRLTEFIRIQGKIDYDGPRDEPVRGLVFRGLTFTHGDRWSWEREKTGWGLQHDWEMFDRPTALVRFRGAEDCAVANCRFTESGGAAIRLDLHCQRNRIENNSIENIGGVGVLLAGYGPGTKDVNKHNEVVNNHIRRVGRLLWHSAAIFAWQSGENRIANNLIHNTPYTAIVVSGRISWTRNGQGECSKTIRWDEVDRVLPKQTGRPSWRARERFLHGRRNIVERNEIHHTMEILGDGNCIYVSGTGDGNIVRQNYLHDVDSPNINASIRCDDDQHGTIMDRNIIHRCCGEGFIIKGNNTITNNIVADLRLKAPDGTPSLHTRGYIVLPYGSVKGATIQRNIFFCREKGQKVLFEGRNKQRGLSLLRECNADNNLYFNTADPDWGRRHLEEQRKYGIETNSVAADPLFVDASAGDFRLRPDSPARALSFGEIDIKDIGLTPEFPRHPSPHAKGRANEPGGKNR